MTSSPSEKNSVAAPTDSISRQRKIDIIRSTIRQEKISPEEIDLPHRFDLLALCVALSSFPVKISFNKITVLLALACNQLTQQQIQSLLGCEQSTLSHIMTDLLSQGFVTRNDASARPLRMYSLAPQGKQIFELFINNYYKAVDYLNNIKEENSLT